MDVIVFGIVIIVLLGIFGIFGYLGFELENDIEKTEKRIQKMKNGENPWRDKNDC